MDYFYRPNRNPLLHFLKLIRPGNLLIIAATMYLLRIFVIGEVLEQNEMELQLSNYQFAVLVLSIVCIAAAGNIINDYFDVRTDRVNRPKQLIVGVYVKRRVAMVTHIALNFAGVIMGGLLAWEIGIWKLVFIHVFAAASLWYYSVIFKREFLIGNIVIAILSALIPLTVGLFEIPLIMETYGTQVREFFSQNAPGTDPNFFFKILYFFVLGFAGFAFLLTLIREIQKDMADVIGDQLAGFKTMPIVMGERKTKILVTALLVVTVVAVMGAASIFFGDYITLIYAAVAIALPLLISMIKTWRAKEREQYVSAFNFTKLAMVTGLGYSILFSLASLY